MSRGLGDVYKRQLYSSSCNPLFPLSPPHSPLAIVRLFLTSMSLVIFCLLFSSVDYSQGGVGRGQWGEGTTGSTIKNTWTKSRGKVEVGEGGGFGWGGVGVGGMERKGIQL